MTNEIKEIDGKKYLIEYDTEGKIICKTLWERQPPEPEPVIDLSVLSDADFKKLILQKLGYKVKEAGIVK
jgi:hypothetical protein